MAVMISLCHQLSDFHNKTIRLSIDYELTMRDQRMLDSLKRIPRRTKICLRNYLTRRYPAVPIPSEVLRRTDLDKDAVDIFDVNGAGEDEQDESDYIDVGNDLTYIGLYSVF